MESSTDPGVVPDPDEGEIVVRVTAEGRVLAARRRPEATNGASGVAGALPLPSPGQGLASWLDEAIGTGRPGRESTGLVLVVTRGLSGAGLVVRLQGSGARPVPGGEAAPAALPRRLVGFKRRRMFLFDPAAVLAFELRTGLVHATLDDGESYVTNYTIRELALRLGPRHFFRAHRDVLVNLKRVKEIERVGQGRLRLLLDTPDARGFTASRPASARLRRLLRF